MLKVRSPQDFGAGILFIVIGMAGLYLGRELAFGSSARMGPGYFPTILSWLVIALGAFVGGKSLVFSGPSIEAIQLRPMLLMYLAILLFGFAMNYVGLALTAIATTFVAATARRNVNWRETVVLAVVLGIGSVIVFIYGLGQAMPAWWGR